MANFIETIEKNDNDEVLCIYCKKNPSNHFLCDSCGAGMCDECYDIDREHTEHYNKPLDVCEDIHIDAIKKVCNNEDPDYICEACMKKALSLQEFSAEYDAKFYHIQNNIQEIVGKRFKDKTDLELFLQNKYDIKSIDNVDESGLVTDYAFIGSISENCGYLDIYYLKVPYGEETIYITEVNAVNE